MSKMSQNDTKNGILDEIGINERLMGPKKRRGLRSSERPKDVKWLKDLYIIEILN